MGPYIDDIPFANEAPGRRPVPLSEAGGSRDSVKEMQALVASHPTLTWIRPPIPGGRHAATWDDDEGSQRAEEDYLGDLVRVVRARLHR
jgi:hypothetical protein